MKKNFKYALLGAIALTGAVSFSACQSSDEIVDNPNYNPETNEVLTQFVFNVSTGNQSMTRQSAGATQAHESSLTTNQFRGIENAHILTLHQTDNGKYLTDPNETVTKDFDMARVLAPKTLSSDVSRRVLEMSLPLQTNTMLFYGRAVIESDKNEYGYLDENDGYNISSTLSNLKFHMARRLSTDKKVEFQEIQLLFASILSCVMNVDRGTTTVAATDLPGTDDDANNPLIPYGFAVPTSPKLKWSDYVEVGSTGAVTLKTTSPVDNETPLTQLEIKLANVYKEMTSIQLAELRNASGPALLSTIKNLWSIINSVRCANPTNIPEAYAKYMAYRISLELGKYFAGTASNSGASLTSVSINGGASDLLSQLENDSYYPGSNPASTKTESTTEAGTFTYDNFNDIVSIGASDLAKFPETYNLPQGSTHITFNHSTKLFSYAEEFNTSAMPNTATFTVDDYYYPSELLYFGNSPIRVSATEHVVTDYPSSTTLWHNTDKWGNDWVANSSVQSTTRSVAMQNDINYGTALLKTTVQYASTELKDNNAYIQNRDYQVTESNKTINVTDNSFVLKGILIGGQYPRVGWNFLPSLNGAVGTTPADRQGYVYDNAITNDGFIGKATGSEPNYTLVFDNYNSSVTTQDKVYVALELQNNTSEDFFGKDNLIPAGANFYLIGELDPTSNSITSWPTYHALPPYIYDTGGTQTRVTRVFIQDYMTTANFKIGEWSLQYAYLTVPDLRSSSVTLGLSVDVEWSTGLTFDDVVVGGKVNTPLP